MTDFYSTQKETIKQYQEEADKYRKIKKQIKQEIKRHRALAEGTEDEEYKLAHSMVADELEELLGGENK